MAAKTSLAMAVGLVAVAVVLTAFSSPASGVPLGRRYRVGGPGGWRVPPPEEKEMYYVKWASPITFYVEDSIEFVYKNDSVIKVSKAGYYHCNETVGIGTGAPPRDGSTLFLLDEPGLAYFACADTDHCMKGERLMINVVAPQPPPAPSPAKAPGAAPPSPMKSSPSPSSAQEPAPAMEYDYGGAAASLAASFARAAVVPAAVLALVGLLV